MNRKIKISVLLIILFCFRLDAQPKTWQWINELKMMTTFSWSGDLDKGSIENFQLDDSGNVYVNCLLSNGGASLVKNGNLASALNFPGLLSTSGPFSILAKFNCKGDLVWYKRGNGFFEGINLDKNGNIYTVRSNDTPSKAISVFDKDTLRRTPANTLRRGYGWFLLKYDRNGNLLFRTKFEMEYLKDASQKNDVNFNTILDHCLDSKGDMVLLFSKDTGNIVGYANTFSRGYYLIKASGTTGNITSIKKIADVVDRWDPGLQTGNFKDTTTFNYPGTFRKIISIGDRLWIRVRPASDYFKKQINLGFGFKYGKLNIDGNTIDSVKYWSTFHVIFDENFNYVGKFKPLISGKKNHVEDGLFYVVDPQVYGSGAIVMLFGTNDSTLYNGQYLKSSIKAKNIGGINFFKVTKDGIAQKMSGSNFGALHPGLFPSNFNLCGINPLNKNVTVPINTLNRSPDGSLIREDSLYFNQTPVSSVHAGTGKTKFMELDSNLNFVKIWNDSIAGFESDAINFLTDSRGNSYFFGAKRNGSLVGLNGVNYPASNTGNNSYYSDYFIAKYGDTVCSFCTKPTGSFSLSAVNRTLTVTDSSTNATSYVWKWGDNTPNGSGKNPGTHTYAANGNYNVCRIAVNSCGTDSSCKQITINCNKPSGGFKTTINKRVLSINDSSSNATSISWTWGDGTANGAGVNPTHTYAKDSTYKVCRIASNVCGSDTTCKTIIISTVSIAKNALDKFKMYPNPAKGAFVLEYEGWNETLEYRIFDMKGVKKQEGKLEQKQTLIDINQFIDGTYIIMVHKNGNEIYKANITIRN